MEGKMEFENLKDIIGFAIEKEKEAAAFYTEVSLHESASGNREMFKSFAREEQKHQALLERILEDGPKEGVAEYKLKWIPDIKRSNYLVDIEYRKGMDYRDILLLAMKREEKALALYNDLQNKSESNEQKKAFQMLSQEEAKHKLALESIYDDYMAKLGD